MQNEQDKIVKILGTDDSVNVCDCCGKSNLKETVALETESGSVVHYGVVCASRSIGVPAKSVKSQARSANDEKFESELQEKRKKADFIFAKWVSHLVALTGGIKDFSGSWDVFRMIQAAGGYAKAKESFKI